MLRFAVVEGVVCPGSVSNMYRKTTRKAKAATNCVKVVTALGCGLQVLMVACPTVTYVSSL